MTPSDFITYKTKLSPSAADSFYLPITTTMPNPSFGFNVDSRYLDKLVGETKSKLKENNIPLPVETDTADTFSSRRQRLLKALEAATKAGNPTLIGSINSAIRALNQAENQPY